MAKSGTVSVVGAPKSIKFRANYTLTKEVANSLFEIVKQGRRLFTNEQWATNSPIVIVVGETRTEVKPQTYNNWITRESVVPGTGKTLKAMMREAKELREQLRHNEQRRQLIKKAEEGLRALQALPDGTKTTITKKKYRSFKGSEMVLTGLETEEQVRNVDPQMVSIKHRGNEYVLDRLSPEFSPKSENKNLTVMLSLADLRRAKEEKDGKKHADYEQ